MSSPVTTALIMVSDICLLIALPLSSWTMLLDKGHCDQYNRIYLNTVSSIVSRSVAPGEELSCRQRQPYVFTPIFQPLSLTCRLVQISLLYRVRHHHLPTQRVPLPKPFWLPVGHCHWPRWSLPPALRKHRHTKLQSLWCLISPALMFLTQARRVFCIRCCTR